MESKKLMMERKNQAEQDIFQHEPSMQNKPQSQIL